MGAILRPGRSKNTARQLPGNTQFAFQFVVPLPLMLEAVLGALAIGLLGGLLPAIRAGRMPVSQALSEQ